MDVSAFSTLPEKVSEITKSFPDINTVFINAGIMKSFSFADPSTSSNEDIIEEVTTNLTAPLILARLFMPHLLSLKKPVNILMTSSGLAFVPIGYYPVYCPTKAAIHSFCVALRQQLKPIGAAVNVIEIAPPYVDTALDTAFRDRLNEAMGDHAQTPMPLEEYMDKTMATLEGSKASELREVATGFAEMGASIWRAAFGKVLAGMGIDA